ncbi:hypothetical protein O9H85_14590 [Paenibacillus filicis]|uniref:LiaF transmembrane domain-containing protein n=1 Tax=Paenibacillus gyeongsangnamensis TaxID=3388067 RepID=A0ABT4Q9T1_9BACL|nr:hypothetical protein [Paenibacillus filicis]MCZ8513642.1 hypothetical protein [Paenibacillus filicis]
MRMNRKTGLAALLIFFGIMILCSKIGGFHHIGHSLIGFLFPLAMVGLGYLGIKNGRSTIGWILVVIGGLILFGKLSGLIAIAVAVGLIVYGFSLFRNRSVH